MAEAVVSSALKTFSDFFLEEGRFLYGVGDDVKALETQLKETRCLLKDADRRRHENETIFNYFVQTRDLADEAEDAIEIHASRRQGLRHFIHRCCCILVECCWLHQVGSEVSQIKSDLASFTQKLRDSIDRDGGESSAANNNQNWCRMTFPEFQIDECFVGMENELKQLKSLLVDNNEHRVISVWGMGGSGKTTIAKKVYNHIKETKKGCFDSFAWVCISKKCEIWSVLEDILSQLKSQKNENVSTSLHYRTLIVQLQKIQREKRCLIVMDDLWETTHWEGFRPAFQVLNLQSKILITTRDQNVAKIGFPVKLGHLNIDNALELLKNKAFPGINIPDEENFEKIGKKMVQKLGCLPLAISLLGGVLRKKNSMREWEFVNENISKLMYRGEGHYQKDSEIDAVLNLSYESLPYDLKHCFLSLGILKEDQRIPADYVYAKWIALGMIAHEKVPDNKETLRDVADLYLSELASRSIVELCTGVGGTTPKRKYAGCKLHDVIRELCLKLGENEDFGVRSLEYEGGNFSTLLQEASSHIKIRHLAIHVKREVEPELTITRGEDTSRHLRSLQIFNHVKSDAIEFPPQNIVDFQKFKLLRDLVMVRFKFAGRKLQRGITNLVHLRCLRLQECELDELPSSISNLMYLDTLHLGGSRNVQFPDVLKKMFQLRYLFLPKYDEDKIGNYRVQLDEGLDELESLMWLDSRVHELKCMGRMKNLQELTASIYDKESLLGIMNTIATKCNKLVHSWVTICDGCELGTSDEGYRLLNQVFTCPNLHRLTINVKIERMVAECGSDFSCSNLTNLWLVKSEIEDDPMSMLGTLPCLTDLYLSLSFVGREMTCPSPSFPRLQNLILSQLPNLKEWRVEAGAMPLLSELWILECCCLEKLPDGLRGISTLKKLKIKEMPELEERISSASGEDFHKVSHVPSIIID